MLRILKKGAVSRNTAKKRRLSASSLLPYYRIFDKNSLSLGF